jgi:BrnA antitoxin of type II toxin-antitoxin system
LNNMSEEQIIQKVQITIKLDADVLEFFKKRASQANAAPYQTQINQELRAVIDSVKKAKVKSKKVKIDTKQLLADKKFIKALAEEIKNLN